MNDGKISIDDELFKLNIKEGLMQIEAFYKVEYQQRLQREEEKPSYVDLYVEDKFEIDDQQFEDFHRIKYQQHLRDLEREGE